MKINSRNIAKVLFWTVIAYAWLTGTLLMSALYLALSTMLNDGHPWPYNPLLLFGLIPLVIAGGLAVLSVKMNRKLAGEEDAGQLG